MFFKLFLSFILGILPLQGFCSPTVIVSIPPHKGLLERIAGPSVHVTVLVPPGASPHSFEPTPKELLSLTSGKLWFRMGEPFEEKALKILKKRCTIADLRTGIPLHCATCHCCHGGEDLHYWLSPKLLKLQAQTMADKLCEQFPENTSLYRENLAKVLADLDSLDHRIADLLKDKKGHFLVVAHSAFAYFCDDYGLVQLSIEEEGKEPTLKALIALIEKAKAEKVFIAVEPYSPKGIQLIAKENGAKIVSINPYAEDPLANLEFLARTLHDFL